MADKAKKSEISPALLLTGALGLGLVIFGLSKLGGPKGTPITAHVEVEHKGLAEDLKLNVRFGDDTILGFRFNSDLVKTVDWHVDAHPDWTLVEADVRVLVPAKQNILFLLPFTYDAKLEIQRGDGSLYPDGVGATQDIKENVFTHTENFEVIML